MFLLFQNHDYFKLGMYTVMSVVQGGCGLPCLSRPFFNYLIEGEYTGISSHVQVTDIREPQLKFIVEKVRGCVSVLFTFKSTNSLSFTHTCIHTNTHTHMHAHVIVTCS